MTQEDVIKMVEEADLGFLLGDNWMLHHELEAFAKLVAAHEREACAQIADEWSVGYPNPSTIIATAIRARGEQA